MAIREQSGGGVIFGTIFVAVLLTIIALPDWARPARPEFVAMMVVYWCLSSPERFGVGMAFIAGIVMDVAQGALLGQHALVYTIMAWITLKLHQRMRVFPIWQQAMSVFLLLVLSQMMVLWIKGLAGHPPQGWSYWLPSFTSLLLWPLFTAVMRTVRRYFAVG